MNIGVLSGKGGTGKTTVSTNLALALKANYVDCDVEEPNGFIFLNPEVFSSEKVMVEYPVINSEKCTLCGACVKACQFNALIKILDEIMVLEQLCHSCGACEIACPTKALSYSLRETGTIEHGKVGKMICSRGILNVGEPMAGPIIRKLCNELYGNENVLDCSPGTSCNVVHTLSYVESAILITEPSEFGLHDLKMAVELVRLFEIPFGVIINKEDNKDNIVREYCIKEKINIIGSIPYSKEIAQIYSKGELLYHHLKYKVIFDDLSEKIKEVL